MEKKSETKLFQSINHGDEKAFKALHTLYWPLLYAHGIQLLKNSQEVEDILQELFIYIWQNKEKIDFSQIRPYLYVSLRNRVLNKIAHHRVKEQFAKHALKIHEKQSYIHVEEDFLYQELEENIEKNIRALPTRMQQIFRMSRNEHLTHQQIAEQLNLSTHTIKKTINRALKLIKSKLHILFLYLF